MEGVNRAGRTRAVKTNGGLGAQQSYDCRVWSKGFDRRADGFDDKRGDKHQLDDGPLWTRVNHAPSAAARRKLHLGIPTALGNRRGCSMV